MIMITNTSSDPPTFKSSGLVSVLRSRSLAHHLAGSQYATRGSCRICKTFRECLGNIQGTLNEHSRNIHSTFKEQSQKSVQAGILIGLHT